MTDKRGASGAALIADLNDLLQLDRDATEAYTIAINSVRSVELRDTLVAHRADHLRHVDELGTVVRGLGGMAIELPHITGPLKMALQAMGGATMRDANVLLALRIVEGQVREQYARYASRVWPEDITPIIRRAAAEEEVHYRWLLGQLQQHGYGDQSLAGSVGAAAEAVHKLVMTPIEALGKQFMRVAAESNPWAPSGDQARSSRTDGLAPSATSVADKFQHALHALESQGDMTWMAALFAADAQVTGPLLAAPVSGADGIREYWTAHARTFAGYHTTIDQITPASRAATVQWTATSETEGSAAPVRGVTVIEHQAGRITRLQEFFDPTPLVQTS